MPRYDFKCPKGHVSEYVLPMDRRDDPLKQRCRVCHAPLKRVFTAPSIKGEHETKTFYEHERNAWALATGQAHNDARELETWCAENGKSIVSPGFKPKKPEDFSEREALKALDKVYSDNHGLGEVR